MKIETENRDDHQMRLVAEIDAEQFEGSKRRAARKISQEHKIPGFRPGKAPYDIVRRTAGDETILRQAIDLLLDEVYPKAIEEAGIKPFGPGTLEEILSQDPPRFAFIVPLEPSVELGDYRSIRFPYSPPEVGDKEIEEFLDRLRKAYATLTPVERPAGPGDMLSVTVTGKVNSEDGNDEVIVDNRPLQATIPEDETDNPEEWPFPGFSRQLAGLEGGSEKPLQHTFVDESPYENLRGKTINFLVKASAVKSVNLPELDDEFSQTVGQFESVEDLKKSVRANLEATARSEYDQGYFNLVLEKVQADSMYKYPPQAVDDQVEQVLHALGHDLARQNLDLETYLKIRQMERADFIEKEVKPAAVRRLERSLTIEELIHSEDLQINKEALESIYQDTLAELQNLEQAERQGRKAPATQLSNAAMMESINRVMNQQIFERMKAIATGDLESQPAKVAGGDAETELEVSENVVTSIPEAATTAKVEGKKKSGKQKKLTGDG